MKKILLISVTTIDAYLFLRAVLILVKTNEILGSFGLPPQYSAFIMPVVVLILLLIGLMFLFWKKQMKQKSFLNLFLVLNVLYFVVSFVSFITAFFNARSAVLQNLGL